MDYESKIMELIINGGDARGKALQAVEAAQKGEFAQADALMQESADALNEAHKMQAEIIRAEVNGESVPVTLLMVHAQDHLMNAITVKDLALQMIEMAKKISGNQGA